MRWLVILGLLTPAILHAQYNRHNWYFGNSVNGIEFNRGTDSAALVTNQNIPFGTGGSAVATDPANANLLFYTDGSNVFDGCYMQMPNGNGLNGNTSANQPVAISAVPGQPNKYFIFTNTANFTAGGTVSRSVVDLTLFGNSVFPAPAQGDLETPKNVAIPGLVNRSEGMITVPHANGVYFWLITHEAGTQNYSATLIDSTAYSGTFSTVTSSGLGLPITVANFAYNAAQGRVAVAPQSASVDAIILNFDNTNGTFSFDRTILNSGFPSTTNQMVYDIEWSPSGQYLYLSQHGEAGINADLYQYDYTNPTITFASVLPSPVFRSYGLQMAPDSTIYHLFQATSGGPFQVGRLSDADSVAAATTYDRIPFGTTDFNGTQFSSFLPRQRVIINVAFTSIGTCENSPTTFFPDVTPGADNLLWDFGDGSNGVGWSPVYTYGSAGTFNVTLTATYQGQTQSATQPITINPFPLELQLVQDTTACRSEFPPPRGSSSPQQFQVTVQVQGGTPTSYTWSNGDTGPTLTPDSAGYYYVVVTDASGCSAYAGVNVKEYGLQDQRANIWYFGTNAGIDFNTLPNPPVPLDDSAMDAPEGCSVISDRNGEVIFYTDGSSVYDRNHTEIATNIGGNPLSAQSALIVPVPGDETLYYIFTTQAIDGIAPYELRYSLFDLKQNGGLGAVVQQDVLLFARSTERITANGTWLIAHEYGNNSFRAYPISALGIGDPVISSIGSDHSLKTVQNGEGYMKLGPRNNLAVALSTPGVSNLVELFTLNDTTGQIRNYRPIDLNEPNGQVYGVEFSPGGNKVFATLKGSPAPSAVYEYFLDSLDNPHLRQIVTDNSELGAMQISPTGQIFMAINGSGVLGTIQASEDTTQNSAIVFNGFTLAAGTTSGLGLPNFIQIVSNAFGGPAITVSGICFGTPSEFVGTPTDAIDNFLWFFGDGGSDTNPAPTHSYPAPSTYNVSLNLTNRCGLDTVLMQPVTIFAPPPPPTVPGATALCTGSVTLDANTGNLPNLAYAWSTGDTTRTIVVNQPAIIDIQITDANGCTSQAQSFIVDNRPQVDLGPDITICEDNATPPLNAQNPGATFDWTVNGGSNTNGQSRTVDTTTPGVYDYTVVVTDPVTTCTATDSKVFTIKVSPNFTLAGTNPTICNGTDGTITLQINNSTPAGGPYTYFVNGPGGFNQTAIDVFSPSTIGPVGGQRAGTFSAIVTDQISQCTISTAIGLSDPATFTADFNGTDCDPSDLTATITSGAPVAPILYTFTNGTTGQTFGPQVSATANFTPAAGDYVVQVHENNGTGCLVTVQKTITISPKTVNITPDLCIAQPTLTAVRTGGTGPFNYSWAGPGIVSGGSTDVVTINASGTYTVTTTDGAGCPVVNTIDVIVDNALTPTLTQSTACAPSVLLSASPAGSFTYRWYRSGVFQPTLQGQQISLGLADNGATFAVEVVNTLNGCVYRSPDQVVVVSGIVDANLSATPACDDAQPFTLTTTTQATNPTFTWYRNGTVIPNETSATLSQTDEGTFLVEVTKPGCIATAQIQVTRAPLPVGNLPNRVVICNDPDNTDPNTSMVDLDPGTFSAYNWFKNELTLNYTSQVLTADSEGLYRVDITNSFGCVAPDETEVRNECVPVIVAPNAFRPTSSIDANKNFFVYSFFVTEDFQILIFNRWGELVFESKDRNFRWDGSYNNSGKALPGGTYAYVIKYVSAFRPEKGIQEQRGGVALIR
ncbi:MAG: PKD domain-containing protein [Cyclobacteriaceae bacterium]